MHSFKNRAWNKHYMIHCSLSCQSLDWTCCELFVSGFASRLDLTLFYRRVIHPSEKSICALSRANSVIMDAGGGSQILSFCANTSHGIVTFQSLFSLAWVNCMDVAPGRHWSWGKMAFKYYCLYVEPWFFVCGSAFSCIGGCITVDPNDYLCYFIFKKNLVDSFINSCLDGKTSLHSLTFYREFMNNNCQPPHTSVFCIFPLIPDLLRLFYLK